MLQLRGRVCGEFGRRKAFDRRNSYLFEKREVTLELPDNSETIIHNSIYSKGNESFSRFSCLYRIRNKLDFPL